MNNETELSAQSAENIQKNNKKVNKPKIYWMNIGQRSMNWKKNKEHKHNNGNGKGKQNVLVVFLCIFINYTNKRNTSVFKAFCVESE